jgi:chemotaxis protein methyltransferase CheR
MISSAATDPSLAPLLAACSQRLAQRLGLNYPGERWPELVRALEAAAPELGCRDLRACLEELAADRLDAARVETLSHHLTVGETYFFRDPAAFVALREHILAPLLRLRRGRARGERCLRLWSAGCSTGEEAYSLAIAVSEAVPDLAEWRITILASDLNVRALARARHGAYPEWSFRTLDPALKARHFTRDTNGRYRIDPRLQAMVSFVPLNLVEEVYPAVETNTTAMDVVFCRNVLMYLAPAQARAVVERLGRCLADGGWLVVSAVEAALMATSALCAQRLPGVLLFRNETPACAPLAAHVAAPVAPRAAARDGTGRRAAPHAPRRAVSAARPAPAGARTARTPASAPDARLASAAAHHAAGRYGEAAAQLEALLAQSPEHGEAICLLARVLANLGRLPEALRWCDRALAAQPLDPACSYLRGSILVEQGQLDGAAAAFQRSLYVDPDFALAQFALGNILGRRGQSAAAARHYRRALAALRQVPRERLLPEADGMPAGRLIEMIESILELEAAA